MQPSLWSIVKQTLSEFGADKIPRLGAALAYYTVFSIAPLVVIAVAIVGFVFGEQAAQGELQSQLETLMGEQGAQFVQSTVAATRESGGGVIATIVGVITLLFGASGALVELQAAMNQVWDVEPDPDAGWKDTIRVRLLSFGMILVIGFLLLVSLVLSAVISGLGGLISEWIALPPASIQLLNQGVSFLVIALLFAAMFKFLPDRAVAWGDVWLGAAITAVLFGVGKWLIGLYIGHSGVASTYGAAASLVVLLVWVYYSAQVVLLGAEFTSVWATNRGSLRGKSRKGRIAEAEDEDGWRVDEGEPV